MSDDEVIFEWDEHKRIATIEKHGLDFRRAVEFFAGSLLVGPARNSGGHARWLSGGSTM